MINIEILAHGFYGGSDATDDRVIWVSAQNKDQVVQAMEGTKATFGCDLPDHYTKEYGIDYVLPQQADELKSKLLRFENVPHY